MIQILIAEDNHAKLHNIKQIILDLNIDSDFVDAARSVKEAKTLLYHKYYDLVILDLVLPNELGDDPNPKDGAMLLNDIYSNPMIKTPMYIIGLTQFDELMDEYQADFKSRLWHLINYQAESSEWEEQLKSITFHLIKARERFLKNSLKRDEYDVAIITALLKPEFEAVYKLSASWERVPIDNDVTHYYKTVFEGNGKKVRVIAASADQMGMTAASHLATKMILFFKPKYLIMAGILAGIKDRELGFGDIIVADQCWDYGSGKMIDQKPPENQVVDIKFEPDLRPIQLASELKAKVAAFGLHFSALVDQIQSNWQGPVPSTRLKAVSGPVASGSYVISSEKTLQKIKETQRKLIGVEMESYGVYYAADHSADRTKAIAIKSVTDYGDGDKNDQYQKYAAYTSAQFVYHFILNELF